MIYSSKIRLAPSVVAMNAFIETAPAVDRERFGVRYARFAYRRAGTAVWTFCRKRSLGRSSTSAADTNNEKPASARPL